MTKAELGECLRPWGTGGKVPIITLDTPSSGKDYHAVDLSDISVFICQ